MFRKIKARGALSVITAIIAITGAMALAMGSVAHAPQTAAGRTASITDAISLLKLDIGVPSKYNGCTPPDCSHIWPTKTSGPA